MRLPFSKSTSRSSPDNEGDGTGTVHFDPNTAPDKRDSPPHLPNFGPLAQDDGTRRLGRYELQKEIGGGGMGRVFMAFDPELKRVVALKTIRSGFLAETREIERFHTEAQAIATLRHPHIVRIFDAGQSDGQHYFAMEFFPGGTLAKQLKRFAKADPREAVQIVVKIARAVQHAHENHILHRDLKPSNILLDEQGEPQVADFGLAKFLDNDEERTRTGQAVGTLPYMAPEQVAGAKDMISPRTDVWALGVILYELLTGRRPFPGKSKEELTPLILKHEPPALARKLLRGDRFLEAIVFRCLEKDPARRFGSAQELADDLERWLKGEATVTRPLLLPERLWRWIGRRPLAASLLVALFVALASGLGIYLRWDPDRWQTQIREKLARGEKVVLIDEAGKSLGYRWLAGKDKSTIPEGADQFSVSTWDVALIELVRGANVRRFRFEAEVRHVRAAALGWAGLMIFHNVHRAGEHKAHCFTALTFSDHEDIVAQWARDVQKLGAPKPEGNHVRLQAMILGADFPAEFPGLVTDYVGHFRPGDPANPPWRKVALEVDDEHVRCIFDESVGVVELKDFRSRAIGWNAKNPWNAGKPFKLHLPELDRVFATELGIGLYVRQSDVQFKNVVIEPLLR